MTISDDKMTTSIFFFFFPDIFNHQSISHIHHHDSTTGLSSRSSPSGSLKINSGIFFLICFYAIITERKSISILFRRPSQKKKYSNNGTWIEKNLYFFFLSYLGSRHSALISLLASTFLDCSVVVFSCASI